MDPTQSDPELLDALPGLFKEWAGTVPIADLLRLSEAFGGTSIYIPMTVSGPLVDALGEASARRLVDLAKGDIVSVPICRKVRCLLQGREVTRLRGEGHSTNQIARTMKMTVRNVQLLLREERERAARRGAH